MGNEPEAGETTDDHGDPAQPAGGEAVAQTAPGPDTTTAAPAVAEDIAVRVLSRPEGAAVYFNDERKPRGKTPLNFSVRKGTGEVRVTLRLDGYREVARSFVPDNNKEYDLQLRRERRSNATRTPIKKPRDDSRTGAQKQPTPDDPKNPRRTDKDKIQEDVGLEDPF